MEESKLATTDRHDWGHPQHIRFVRDMERASLRVQHYRGRFYWEGPAVVVDNLQDALGTTRVPCQWDHMGLGWVVYPSAYATSDATVTTTSREIEGGKPQ
jgi:hypothetical protein